MIIKLNHVFKTFDGEALFENVRTGKKDEKGNPVTERVELTMKRLCQNFLLIEKRDTTGRDKPLSSEEKFNRHNLALEIHNADDEIDLSVDDVKLLKDLVGELGTPLVVGQAWPILDPPAKEVKKTFPKKR